MPPSDRPRARSSEGAELKPARIVVADDERLARDLLAGILRNAGHLVETVEDGQDAVDRVSQGGVDLVLLDVMMPRLSGIEACRLLKAMTVESFLPVLLSPTSRTRCGLRHLHRWSRRRSTPGSRRPPTPANRRCF